MTFRQWLSFLPLGLVLTAAGRSALPEPQLHRSVLTLAPSDRQLETLPHFEPIWFIPEGDTKNLDAALVRDGFNPHLARDLASRLQREPATADAWIVPDRSLLARFTPLEHERWLRRLAGNPANITYRWPLTLGSATLAKLDAQPRWREAVTRLRAAAIPHGDQLVFGDLFVLEDAFATPQDRLDFYRVALGSDALLLKLRREPGQPLDATAQAAWWQVNGRYRAIEPLLNAVAAIPDAPRLDLGHVLPLLPRAMLNTFPPVLGDDRNPGVDTGLLATAFFDLHPTVEAGTPGGLEGWLALQCVAVDGPPRYGDFLVYGELERNQWPYTAVYVAQGTAFGRRPTLFGPWQFLDLDEIGRLNPRYAGISPRVFRLKTTVNEPGEPAFLPSRMPAAWRKHLALKPLPAGPWGRLWYYEVLLAPSSRFLEQLTVPDPQPRWTFTGLTREQLLEAVAGTAMPDETRRELHALFAEATPDAAGHLTVRPKPALVLAVPREFRTRVFPRLLGGKLLTDYAQHVAFPAGFSVDEWFDDGSLPDPVRQALLQLVYPVGDRVYLSDIGMLFSLLGSPRERFTAYRAILREPAVVVLMEKPAPDDVPALAAYWRGGRTKDLGTLLASFAANGGDPRYLDILHLLSPIEREFLNLYFSSETSTNAPSCYWTAFNFNAETPDNRYLLDFANPAALGRMAWQDLATRFDRIETATQLGDIIAYRRQGEDQVHHMCVFIAEGLVYTKNGFSFSRPWCLALAERVDDTFLGDPAMERIVFRRKPAPPAP